MKKKIVLILVVTVLLVSGMTLVFADGDDPELIYACVRHNKGLLRIVSPDEECMNYESPLDWPSGTSASSSGLQDVEVIWDTFTSGSNMVLDCPDGKIAIGGGGALTAPGWMQASHPTGPEITGPSGSTSNPTGWLLRYTNGGAPYTVYVICVHIGP